MAGKRKSSRGLAASMIDQPRVFKNLTRAQQIRVIELAADAFGVKGLENRKALMMNRGGFPDLSGDGKTTKKDVLIGRGVVKAKAGKFIKKKGSPKPKNAKLYSTIKTEAKRKFDVWPSAYGSAWLTKTYKARGGTYI